MSLTSLSLFLAAAASGPGGAPADLATSPFGWGDWNGDRVPDALILFPDGTVQLLVGAGDGRLDDVTEQAGLAGLSGVRQAVWTDVDGDGRQDLYLVLAGQPSQLLRSGADGLFLDVTVESGVGTDAPVLAAETRDYDADGAPDLILSTAERRLVLHNRGDGCFEEVALELPPLALGAASVPAPAQPGAGPADQAPVPAPAGGGSGVQRSAARAAGSTGTSPAGPSIPASGMLICAASIDDFAMPGSCMGASSVPMLGMLHPLSQDFFIDPSGRVGIGTTAPAEALEVVGDVRASGQLVSAATSGAPLVVGSSTLVTGLNADLLDGLEASAFSQLGSSIGTAELENQAVTSAKLAPGAVTSSALGTNSVGSLEVIDGSLGAFDLAPNSVNISHIVVGAVASPEIVDGTILDLDISPAANVKGSKIDPDFVQTVTTTGWLGVGTTAPQTDVHVIGDPLEGEVWIAPGETVSGDDASVLLAEDANGVFGMRLRYDGGVNALGVSSRINGTDGTEAFLSVQRDSGDVQIGNSNIFQGRLTINSFDTTAHALRIFANDSNAINATNSWAGGATIYGSQAEATGAGVWGVGQQRGVYGLANGAGSVAVYGEANFTPGASDGVHGVTPNPGGNGVLGRASATTGSSYGVRGESQSTSGRGVSGFAYATTGTTYGVRGESYADSGRGVFGYAGSSTGVTYGVRGQTNSSSGYAVHALGNMGASGIKSFLHPHPTDASKEIRFVSLEGNESGTYFRGSTRLVGGVAEIAVPEDFRLVTEAEGLTVQVTALGPASVWVSEKSLERIVVRGTADVELDYLVNGVRYGYADLPTRLENHSFRPEVRDAEFGTQYPERIRALLVQNGTLNADFTPNEATAAALGWELADPDPDAELRERLVRQAEISATMRATQAQAEADEAARATAGAPRD